MLAHTLREEGSLPGAIERLRVAIDLDPENADAHFLMGLLQMQRQAFTVAEEHLRRAVALYEDQQQIGADLPRARRLLGIALMGLERYDEAVPVLRASAADELNREAHLAWGDLGLAQIRSGNPDSALESLNEAVRMQPRYCLGYYWIGHVHFEAERFEEANEALNSAVESDPACDQFQEARRLRGEVRAHLGRHDEAVADFERCLEINPETPDGQACRRFLEEGD